MFCCAKHLARECEKLSAHAELSAHTENDIDEFSAHTENDIDKMGQTLSPLLFLIALLLSSST